MADVNHRYFVHYVSSLPPARSLRVLDFGCGAGELVRLLREHEVECYGADVFYEGARFDALAEELVNEGIVRRIPDSGRLPFDDGFFDVVISNQVIEHVQDLPSTVDETARVLSDAGLAYHHFPSREVLREGHIGIPLVHRLPSGALRQRYAAALRRIGLGYHKDAASPSAWADEKLAWIDRYCFYRPYAEVVAAFATRFAITHREIEYCRYRANDRLVLRAALEIDALAGAYERVFRRLAFMALEMRKLPAHGHPQRSSDMPSSDS